MAYEMDPGHQLAPELRTLLNDAVNESSNEPAEVVTGANEGSAAVRTTLLEAAFAGDVVGLADGTYQGQRKSFNLIGILASGSLQAVAQANLIDGETFTIDDDVNPAKVFEFDVAGNGVTPGRVNVDVSGATTAASVGVIMAAAINAATPLNIVAEHTGGGLVTLYNTDRGATGNALAETVFDAGFVATGLTKVGNTCVVTPSSALGFTSVELGTLYQGVELEWTGSAWVIVSYSGTPTIT